jgi:hypothetical protein
VDAGLKNASLAMVCGLDIAKDVEIGLGWCCGLDVVGSLVCVYIYICLTYGCGLVCGIVLKLEPGSQ